MNEYILLSDIRSATEGSERNVQTIKSMIRAYVDENQDSWDLGLDILSYQYNTSVHESIGMTPYFATFARHPRLPIDLLFPEKNSFNSNERESVLENSRVKLEDIRNNFKELAEVLEEVDILEDVTEEDLINNGKIREAYKVVLELRQRFKNNLGIINRNKSVKMANAIKHHNRRFKRIKYNIGDWVLVNHPKLKKGLSRGLAPKYYGPFEIIGKHINDQDYLIKWLGIAKPRAELIHKNNLRFYNKRGDPREDAENSNELDENVEKRLYKKDLNNKRWNRSEDAESDSELSEVEVNVENGEDINLEPAIEAEEREIVIKRKPGRPRKNTVGKELNHNTVEEINPDNSNNSTDKSDNSVWNQITSRAGRKIRAPERNGYGGKN